MLVGKDIFNLKLNYKIWSDTLDMEWFTSLERNMDVDLGFQSRMELISSAPSNKLAFEDFESMFPKTSPSYSKPINQISNDSYQLLINGIKWEEEIPLEKAFENLEKSFLRFKEVNFYCFFLFKKILLTKL